MSVSPRPGIRGGGGVCHAGVTATGGGGLSLPHAQGQGDILLPYLAKWSYIIFDIFI